MQTLNILVFFFLQWNDRWNIKQLTCRVVFTTRPSPDKLRILSLHPLYFTEDITSVKVLYFCILSKTQLFPVQTESLGMSEAAETPVMNNRSSHLNKYSGNCPHCWRRAMSVDNFWVGPPPLHFVPSSEVELRGETWVCWYFTKVRWRGEVGVKAQRTNKSLFSICLS